MNIFESLGFATLEEALQALDPNRPRVEKKVQIELEHDATRSVDQEPAYTNGLTVDVGVAGRVDLLIFDTRFSGNPGTPVKISEITGGVAGQRVVFRKGNATDPSNGDALTPAVQFVYTEQGNVSLPSSVSAKVMETADTLEFMYWADHWVLIAAGNRYVLDLEAWMAQVVADIEAAQEGVSSMERILAAYNEVSKELIGDTNQLSLKFLISTSLAVGVNLGQLFSEVADSMLLTVDIVTSLAEAVENILLVDYEFEDGVIPTIEYINDLILSGTDTVVRVGVSGAMVHGLHDTDDQYLVHSDAVAAFWMDGTSLEANNSQNTWYHHRKIPSLDVVRWGAYSGWWSSTSNPLDIRLSKTVGYLTDYIRYQRDLAPLHRVSISPREAVLAVHFNDLIGWLPLSLLKTLAWLDGRDVNLSYINPGHFDAPAWAENYQWMSVGYLKNDVSINPTPTEVSTLLTEYVAGESHTLSDVNGFSPNLIEINLDAIEREFGITDKSGRQNRLKFSIISADKDPSANTLAGAEVPDTLNRAWGSFKLEFNVT